MKVNVLKSKSWRMDDELCVGWFCLPQAEESVVAEKEIGEEDKEKNMSVETDGVCCSSVWCSAKHVLVQQTTIQYSFTILRMAEMCQLRCESLQW